MKIAKIILIYKGKQKLKWVTIESLLPSTFNLLEKLVHQRLHELCKNTNISFENQYGFRPQYSTTDAIAKFITHVSKATMIL